MASASSILLPPLNKGAMAQLSAKAKDLGLSPERYARQLVERGLELERQAESMSIAQIMRPVRKAAGRVDEREITTIVRRARKATGALRSRHGQNGRPGKR